MDREAWGATVHGDEKSRTRRKDFTFFLLSFCSCRNLELQTHPLRSSPLRPGRCAPGTGVTLTWAEGNTPGNWEMSVLVLKRIASPTSRFQDSNSTVNTIVITVSDIITTTPIVILFNLQNHPGKWMLLISFYKEENRGSER